MNNPWIIQGCSNPINIPSSGTTIILPLTMLHPQYMVTLMPINYSGDGIGVSLTNRTVNSFIAKNKNYGSSATVPCLWKLEGYAE